MAAHEAALDITGLPGGAASPELLRVWRRRFNGAVACEAARATLYQQFPSLRAIFNSSLWLLLRHECQQQAIEEMASGTRLDGKALEVFQSRSLPQLCTSPNWLLLAPLLAILRCPAREWHTQKCWLRKNFAAFCALMCLRPPDRKLAVPLWNAINFLVEKGLLGDIDYWPASAESFEFVFQGQIRLGECLICQGWAPGWTDDCLVWLWYLGERSYISTVSALRSSAGGVSVDRPDDLNMRVRRTLAKMASTILIVPE
ncbi:hypothetical protein ACJA3S_19520 [Pseudomonas sp. KnCO4]|uniref:hypothetical protein n=1 Tax=Pseudomonas sp. KnCO4 TaxID=3381355 RepID=UPI003877BB8E